MNSRILIPMMLVVISLQSGYSQVAATDILKLNWLEGNWIRTNNKPGRSGSEQWTRKSDQEWAGLGVNLRGADTAFVEKLRLVVKDGTIFYVADVPENKSLVYFRFTEISNDHFVCENPDHDFPKKIMYRREGKVLKATVSGDGKTIDYLFERK